MSGKMQIFFNLYELTKQVEKAIGKNRNFKTFLKSKKKIKVPLRHNFQNE